jgi:protein O-GlcNAc transferase
MSDIDELEQAAARSPRDAEVLNRLGNAHKDAGNLERAERCYRQALVASPDRAATVYNLAMVLHVRNQLEEAESLFRRLIQIDARDLEVWRHFATILCKRGRFGEGSGAYLKALELDPLDPYLWMGLGNAVLNTDNPVEEAIRFLNRAVELNADIAAAWLLLGVARRRLGQGDAIGAYERALELDPAMLTAVPSIAQIMLEEGRLAEAEARYRKALAGAPQAALLWNGLGCVLFEQSRLADAEQAFRRATAIDAGLAHAHQNLGAIHARRGERDQALRCFSHALSLLPNDAAIRKALLQEMQHVCAWSRLEDLWRRQQESLAHGDLSITPASLLSLPSSAAEQHQCARRHAAQLATAAAPERRRLDFQHARGVRTKLRIGYLAGDLRDGGALVAMAEVLALHDRSAFEVLGFGCDSREASAPSRLPAGFDRFVDLRALSHGEAAARIHADGVDLLIDLAGFGEEARPGIAALRPAPVQASFLGYPGTMAADFIDYLLVDRFVVPPSQREHYGEALVFLPNSHFPYDRRLGDGAAFTRAQAGLPAEGVVFCCFSPSWKITAETFKRWMRVLAEAPDSVLWLLESNPWVAANLRREAEATGIDPQRLLFAPRLPSAEHRRRLAAADLFLDTLPYNARGSAADALWSGVPVVTLPGTTLAARTAGSLLTAHGLQELIAVSEDEWHRMVLELALQPARLASLRERIRQGRAHAPLFDVPAYTRSLEQAYQRMWANFEAGREPAPIEL